MAFSDFGILLGDVSLFEVEHATKDPMKAQEKTLKKILLLKSRKMRIK